MNITVRQMTAADRTAWVDMRSLWPEDAPEAHVDAVNELLNSEENWGLIAETLDREIAGFAEIAVRKYANGCSRSHTVHCHGELLDGLETAARVMPF